MRQEEYKRLTIINNPKTFRKAYRNLLHSMNEDIIFLLTLLLSSTSYYWRIVKREKIQVFRVSLNIEDIPN